MPAIEQLPAIRGDFVTHDYGFAARLTPYNSIDHAGSLPAVDEAVGLRLDISAGWARINDEGETIELPRTSDPDPVIREENQGMAVRGAVGLPKEILSDLETKGAGWLGEALSPLLSLGFNWDNTRRPMSMRQDSRRKVSR